MIEIRKFSHGDYSDWYPLWQGYLTFYKTQLDDTVTKRTWERLLDPQHAVKGLCAVDDKKEMLGIVHYLYHPVTWSIEERCYLEDLFVVQSARGLGVGRALIKAVENEATAAGVQQVYWLTQDFNTTARVLYDRVAQKTPFIKYAVNTSS